MYYSGETFGKTEAWHLGSRYICLLNWKLQRKGVEINQIFSVCWPLLFPFGKVS